MRIGIDIDDTITNTYEDILKEVSSYYKIDYNNLISNKVNYDMLYNSLKDYDVFCKKYYEKIIENVSLKENVVEVLERLNKKYEIIFITARNKNEYNDPYLITKKYLDKNKIPYDGIYTEVINKGKFCYENNIDIFIDDSIKNCNDTLNYKINTIIFDNIYNKNCNIKRLYNWLEIEKYIEEEQWKKE
jgi:uncharacterized HAD superfamily protein